LPKHELLAGILVRTWSSFKELARIFTVLVAWFICVPIGTSLIWRFYFSNNFQFTYVGTLLFDIFVQTHPFSFYYTDCIWGSFLSATIFFTFLGLSSLLEYMYHVENQNHGANGLPDAPPVNNDQEENGEEEQAVNGEHQANPEGRYEHKKLTSGQPLAFS
jgi:hypothetical protein